MKSCVVYVVVVLVGVAASGCGEAPVEVPSAKACGSQVECPSNQLCISPDKKACPGPGAGCTCQPLSAVGGCVVDADCSGGQRCLSNGTCETCECETTADCCGGATECSKICSECQCVGTECVDGTSAECFVGCHRGDRQCFKGVYSACSAAPVQDELCGDGVDNDCNGTTDDPVVCDACAAGQTKPCNSACGAGVVPCGADGLWGECDAPRDCVCTPGETNKKPCGNCGEAAGTCGPDSTWEWAALCTGEGPCSPGAEESEPCGNCGKRVRTCDEACGWGEWSACSEGGQCKPGDVEQQGCGSCGSQQRTCGQDCSWVDWSTCVDGAGCQEGAVQEKSCGKCGTQTSTCDASCEWGPYGICLGEGACVAGEQQEEPCGSCGKRSRTCTGACGWGDWTGCVGAGECSPGDVENQPCGPDTDQGICAFGEQVRSCLGACKWGAWGACLGAQFPEIEICGNDADEDCDGENEYQPDTYEPNGSCGSCTDLGTDPTLTFTATFDQSSDTLDFYCFTAIDEWNVPGFEEHIKVDVVQMANGVDADVYLYKGTQACELGEPTASASGANQDKHIDWGGSTGTDDAGLWIIKVQNYGASGCNNSYTITVDGLN